MPPTQVGVCLAPLEIRDRRLYRDAGFSAFDVYCRERTRRRLPLSAPNCNDWEPPERQAPDKFGPQAGSVILPAKREDSLMASKFDTRPRIDVNRLLRHFTNMVRIRAFEEIAIVAAESGLLMGALHPSIGQEAVAAAVCGNL